MELKYTPETAKWSFDVRDMLAKHDLVFRSPVQDAMYGLPIGDGDTGLLLYLREDGLAVAVNKTDLFSDGGSSDMLKNDTTPLHGGTVKIGLSCPVFDNIYAEDFEARLRLSDATAHIHSVTPFCSAEITAFSSHGAGVSVIDCDIRYTEPMPVDLTLSRWGGGSADYWYSAISGSCSDGLDGTEAEHDGDCMDIAQSSEGCVFAVSVKAVGENDRLYSRMGSHAVKCGFASGMRVKFKLYIAVSKGVDAQDARRSAHGKISDAISKEEALVCEHRAEWREFWNKSFVSLPKDMDFIENLWYLDLYYANSMMRGTSPSYFCNGIWGMYHDFAPWGNYFHYNMQLATFPLEAAGHPELLDTYYDFRLGQLPTAIEYAKTVRGKSGAFYTDVCDRKGRMGQRDDNCSCGAQIALALYRHYQYSLDGEYLKRIMPLLVGVGEFYLDMLTEGDDHRYHIHRTLGYEGIIRMDDSITDLAAIRALFGVLCKELPENLAEPYYDRLERLAEYTSADFVEGEVKDGVFLHGIGKGKRIAADDVLSVGFKSENGEKMRRTFGLKELDYYGFPDTEMAPLFPCSTVGLKDRDTLLFNRIKNSIYLHRPTVPEREKEDGMCMGWCMMPIYMARMGMANELIAQLHESAGAWTAFPQGMSQEGPYTSFTPDNTERWHKYKCRDAATGEENIGVPSWNYRHFNYEALPIIAAAVNEMLMQSYDGVIRLFPAIPEKFQTAFRLYAVGGFTVNALYTDEMYNVTIESRFDRAVKFTLPDFCGAPIITHNADGKAADFKLADGVYMADIKGGDSIRIASPNIYDELHISADFSRCEGMKREGRAQLGEERSFARTKLR